MRIGFVTTEFPSVTGPAGGLANYLGNVSHSLKKLGHDPFIVVASQKDEEMTEEGISIYCVRIPPFSFPILSRIPLIRYFLARRSVQVFFYSLCRSWLLCRKIKKLHAEKPIDIVQYTSLSGVGLFHMRSIPSVARLSSRIILWNIAEYEKIGWPEKVEDYIERMALSRFDYIFGPSILIAHEYSSILRKEVSVIRSPLVVPEKRSKSAYLLLDGKKYLLFFGSIARYKGAIVIANIIEKLLKDYPDLFFVFAGHDKPYQGKTVMSYIWEKSGSYRDRVVYVGLLSKEHLYPLVDGAYGIVLPSLIENFPNACLEAMGFGKIVIGTRGSSMEEMIIDGENGLLCEINDPTSLRQKIDQLLCLSLEEKNKMEQRARKFTEQLRPEITVQELVDYYRKIISSSLRISHSCEER